MLSEFRRIPREFDALLADSKLTGQHTIHLVINAPTGLEELTKVFETMSHDPRVLTAITNGG